MLYRIRMSDPGHFELGGNLIKKEKISGPGSYLLKGVPDGKYKILIKDPNGTVVTTDIVDVNQRNSPVANPSSDVEYQTGQLDVSNFSTEVVIEPVKDLEIKLLNIIQPTNNSLGAIELELLGGQKPYQRLVLETEGSDYKQQKKNALDQKIVLNYLKSNRKYILTAYDKGDNQAQLIIQLESKEEQLRREREEEERHRREIEERRRREEEERRQREEEERRQREEEERRQREKEEERRRQKEEEERLLKEEEERRWREREERRQREEEERRQREDDERRQIEEDRMRRREDEIRQREEELRQREERIRQQRDEEERQWREDERRQREENERRLREMEKEKQRQELEENQKREDERREVEAVRRQLEEDKWKLEYEKQQGTINWVKGGRARFDCRPLEVNIELDRKRAIVKVECYYGLSPYEILLISNGNTVETLKTESNITYLSDLEYKRYILYVRDESETIITKEFTLEDNSIQGVLSTHKQGSLESSPFPVSRPRTETLFHRRNEGNSNIIFGYTCCDCYGKLANGMISFRIEAGSLPITVKITGPLQKQQVYHSLPIYGVFENLCSGKYTMTITDNENHIEQEVFCIEEKCSDLELVFLDKKNPTCSDNGEIQIKVSGGKPPYILRVSGNKDTADEVVSEPGECVIECLNAGKYHLLVIDSVDHSVCRDIILRDKHSDLVLKINKCLLGKIYFTIKNGEPPYRLEIRGAVCLTKIYQKEGDYELKNLDSGSYNIYLVDGCKTVVKENVILKGTIPYDSSYSCSSFDESTNKTEHCENRMKICKLVGKTISHYGAFDGEIYIKVDGGIPPYKYILGNSLVSGNGYFPKLGKERYDITIHDSSDNILKEKVNIGTVCFTKDAYILTDQGTIRIDGLSPQNSINGEKISLVVYGTLKPYSKLVEIPANCFNSGVPSVTTYLTPNHRLKVGNDIIRAECLVKSKAKWGAKMIKTRNITEVYNVYLKCGQWIAVNNMTLESLDHDSIVVKQFG